MEKPVFLTKKQREEQALRRLQEQREEQERKQRQAKENHERFITGKALEERKLEERRKRQREEEEKERRKKEENKDALEHEQELKKIREHYLGHQSEHNGSSSTGDNGNGTSGGTQGTNKKSNKPTEKFSRIFQFEWNTTEDTTREDYNPLYNQRMKINALFGRGYLAGVDQREQRNQSNYLLTLSERRYQELKDEEAHDETISEEEKKRRELQRIRSMEAFKQQQLLGNDHPNDSYTNGNHSYGNRFDRDHGHQHWSEKKLEEMNDRDWRIFREDFDIRIQGGRATLPIRYWQESSIPKPLLDAIHKAGYEKPSPIQRQAIPVGLAKRDLIGIAETGSGKTCAFLVPLISYLLALPSHYFARVKDEGPLAIVLAPTRELAQQIEEECIKLVQYTDLKTICVVGGQNIEEQGFKLRRGVDIIIGTPGRILDCLENNYMVLNQCNYVVLDEADRMIDMGFEDQVVSVMDAMGGLLKSEDEEQAELQVQSTAQMNSLYRVTAMFSATMSTEIELIAKKYLRHPVVVRIGDEDSGKNKRIEQRVFFVTEGQKKGKLSEELSKLNKSDKIIIFVNTKKAGDTLVWHLESQHYAVGVLHGGKSQDQREETLEQFRHSKIQILVATDVAGRGLDIPDVSHVFNYDLPNKIQPYCHRIGRTGRAGKFGVATSFLTDADAEIMYDLRAYLESTGAAIPHQLAHHPAAQNPAGARDEKGKLLSGKKDSVQYLK